MAKLKITVVKMFSLEELFPGTPPSVPHPAESESPQCPFFKEGQEIILERETINDVPEGFCGWAWANIHRDIAHLLLGGYCDWVVPRTAQLVCCTDGMMPVIFKLERIED